MSDKSAAASRSTQSQSGGAKPDAARDYSETLFLPKTDFPMRAGLPQK